MQRTTVVVGERSYPLAQSSGIEQLKTRIQDALHEAGGFVDIVVVGNRAITVLVTAGVLIAFHTADVEDDERDTGDTDHPYLDTTEHDAFLDYGP